MKLIIAGGRDYKRQPGDVEWLSQIHEDCHVTEVVSGCAQGADRLGELWARARGIPVARFPADWKRYGLRAGPLRNFLMAEYADAVALFPGGKGTANMRKCAKEKGLQIFDRVPVSA